MPDDAWRSLIATTRDGIEINPLYTRADEIAERPAPGRYPYVRGGDRTGLPDNGWHVSAREATGDVSQVNTRASTARAGELALWLTAEA